ncbi:hypothetical protein CVT24_008066 [Panaeolus cyanescens]|uniref:Piwi domain-containing protein n=1 Tax=Panaeolus cyanescens TaxID=181874 RepID=A0A409W563_9AGAR|nr:hypothetical protein CVT24_008066 [Panaeolus cyanescens]
MIFIFSRTQQFKAVSLRHGNREVIVYHLFPAVRTAHYVVLRDDIFNNNMQMIEEVAFALCHVYAKATRSVSIPAPVYYADLVCSRGAFHISPDSRLVFGDSASVTSSGDSFDLDQWKRAFAHSAHSKIKEGMYFL